MGLHDPTDQELFDLLALGLAFQRREERDPDDATLLKLDRPSGSIYRGMAAAGTIIDETHRKIKSNNGLASLIDAHTEPLVGRAGRAVILESIRTSEKHLLALVPRGSYVRTGLVGPQSYGLVITEVGLAYADEICAAYAEHITPVQFKYFWKVSVQSMRAMHAHRPLAQPDRA